MRFLLPVVFWIMAPLFWILRFGITFLGVIIKFFFDLLIDCLKMIGLGIKIGFNLLILSIFLSPFFDITKYLDISDSLDSHPVKVSCTDRFIEDKPLLKEAPVIPAKALGPDHPGLATNLNSLTVPHYNMSWYAEAESLCQQALAIPEKALGPDPNLPRANFSVIGTTESASITTFTHLNQRAKQICRFDPAQ